MKMENISYLPQSALALVLLFQGANYRVQAQIAQQHLKTMFEYIQDSEYEIRTVEDQGLYKIANRAQNLRYTLEANKLAIEPRDYGKGKSKLWDATFHFDGLAKGAGRIPFGNPSWEINLKHAQ